jgi:two-component system sensor histidine kinase ResE
MIDRTWPLLKLAGASELMAQDDYQQQIPLDGLDEMKQVVGSFNTMAAQVASTQTAQREFVANVSHDLKTPLTSIWGWSQALLDGAATTPERRQQAAIVIHAEAESMTRMVDQLLDLARLESGQLQLIREPVDLPSLLSQIRDGFLSLAREKGVQIELNANPVPPISGVPDGLTQVFTNLVDNALAHTQTGGRIQLSVYPFGSGTVEVIVQDNGSGIPAAELGRVFERFYQVDKSRSTTEIRAGAGLGLAIAKEWVAAHGGQIAVHSQVGQGSTFTIRLPVDGISITD